MTQDNTSKRIDDLMEEYAEAWAGYNTSDGKPVFKERMEQAKSLIMDLLLEARVEGYKKGYVDKGVKELNDE